MAYDEKLADRVRRLMQGEPEAGERKMFGGLCFTVAGKMCCGVMGRDLLVRIPKESHDATLRAPHVRPMDFTGRPMRGFVCVGPGGTRDARALRRWVAESVAFARSLVVGAKRGPKPRRPGRRADRSRRS